VRKASKRAKMPPAAEPGTKFPVCSNIVSFLWRRWTNGVLSRGKLSTWKFFPDIKKTNGYFVLFQLIKQCCGAGAGAARSRII
jgi:hypothetical protein